MQLGIAAGRVGRFFPEGGKNRFFHGKNRTGKKFLPAKIGFCQNIYFYTFITIKYCCTAYIYIILTSISVLNSTLMVLVTYFFGSTEYDNRVISR